MADYFTIDEKRFLLAYSANARNITYTTFEGILYHIYYNVVYNKVEAIDNVLKLINELKLDFWSMFKKTFLGKNIDLSHGSLLSNPEAFIKLTEAGVSNGSTNAGQLYSWSFLIGPLHFEGYNTWEEKWNDNSGNPLNFRALQLLCLYMRFTYITVKSAELAMAVRVLWSSIPDPLLTMNDIFRLFEGIDPIYYQIINSTWQWYCDLVNYEETSVRRPRSLKHLSRCLIRNRLRDNCKLPEGVEELGIPKHVQKYLLLRDFYEIE